MSSIHRRGEYAELEREIAKPEYQQLLNSLQHRHPFLRQFRSWEEVVVFMRAGSSRDPGKDEILRPILLAYEEEQDPRCLTLAFTIFWPGLVSIWMRLPGPEEEEAVRWANVYWAFSEAFCRLNLAHRQDRFVQKLYNDTAHDVRAMYARERPEVSLSIPDPEDEDESPVPDWDRGHEAFLHRDERAAQITRLQDHLRAGRISEADFYLLLGTVIYGQSIADYARDHDLDYQVARKHRYRALRILDTFEKKDAKRVSPAGPQRGL